MDRRKSVGMHVVKAEQLVNSDTGWSRTFPMPGLLHGYCFLFQKNKLTGSGSLRIKYFTPNMFQTSVVLEVLLIRSNLSSPKRKKGSVSAWKRCLCNCCGLYKEQ